MAKLQSSTEVPYYCDIFADLMKLWERLQHRVDDGVDSEAHAKSVAKTLERMPKVLAHIRSEMDKMPQQTMVQMSNKVDALVNLVALESFSAYAHRENGVLPLAAIIARPRWRDRVVGPLRAVLQLYLVARANLAKAPVKADTKSNLYQLLQEFASSCTAQRGGDPSGDTAQLAAEEFFYTFVHTHVVRMIGEELDTRITETSVHQNRFSSTARWNSSDSIETEETKALKIRQLEEGNCVVM
jgi:hypothetical protein